MIKTNSVKRLRTSMLYEDEEALATLGWEEFADSLEDYWLAVEAAHDLCAKEAKKRAQAAYRLAQEEPGLDFDPSLTSLQRNAERRRMVNQLLQKHRVEGEIDGNG